MGKTVARDVYMNFFTLSVTSGASAASLVSQSANTAAGVSTNFAWRIHVIEFFPTIDFAAAVRLNIALSTRKNLGSMPSLTDKGLLALMRYDVNLGAAGQVVNFSPRIQSFLPPMLIASPSLNLYVQASVNDAKLQAVEHEVRIGFTMVELSTAAFTELWQTWNFAD